MRALIPGGGGFVGRQVVAALGLLGCEAVVPPRDEDHDLLTEAGRAAIVRLAAGAGLLVQAAWTTAHGRYWSDPANLDWVRASTDLARRFIAVGGRRIVLVGSCAEYDWSLRRPGRWAEDCGGTPRSTYGAAKLLAWTALRELGQRHHVAVAEARLFMPVGVGERAQRLLPALLDHARRGASYAVGPGDTVRDIMDVRDCGRAVAALALCDLDGVVNVGSGVGTSLAVLARAVEAMCDVDGLFQLGARNPGIHEPRSMVADIDRLVGATGFRRAYTLTDAIAAMWPPPPVWQTTDGQCLCNPVGCATYAQERRGCECCSTAAAMPRSYDLSSTASPRLAMSSSTSPTSS